MDDDVSHEVHTFWVHAYWNVYSYRQPTNRGSAVPKTIEFIQDDQTIVFVIHPESMVGPILFTCKTGLYLKISTNEWEFCISNSIDETGWGAPILIVTGSRSAFDRDTTLLKMVGLPERCR